MASFLPRGTAFRFWYFGESTSGDFNQPPEQWLSDRPALAPWPTVPTYPAAEPRERIDYCLVAGVDAEARPIPSLASDHLPLLIDLKVHADGKADGSS